ncbi:hypothetical protein [Campylobacter sputorum]|uniref:hypothetical protein n=1 Tax=Campylobacter sputorum TaxID=206 RepID=UPI00053BEDF7|nr:hypothetical protein [Campylobacter sputorum]
MKVRNFIFRIGIMIALEGCVVGPATYENFVRNMNLNAEINTPIMEKWKNKEIYDENRYIYKIKRPDGCHYGFLTNRDDKPERVIDWIILSGKEYCKDQTRWTLS